MYTLVNEDLDLDFCVSNIVSTSDALIKPSNAQQRIFIENCVEMGILVED